MAALEGWGGRGALLEGFDVMQEALATAPAVAAVFFHVYQIRDAAIATGLDPVAATLVFDGFNQKFRLRTR